jgi:glycosyltransferase involved in cell wall biosynthesis
LDACTSLGHDVRELRLGRRSGRTAEFRDTIDRSLRARRLQADLFHATHAGAWGSMGLPTVTSILDVIPIDLGSHYGRTGMKTKLFLRLAARSDAVLTLSEFSAERIVERLGVEPEAIVVAPLYPTAPFRAAGPATEPDEPARPYALTVMDMSTPDPRKRPDWVGPIAVGLAEAGVDLKVIGAGTEGRDAAMGGAEGLGRVSDEEMARLFSKAACFVYFSAYEGQGLPPLEAMAAGAPVVAVANTAVTEVVGDGGVLIDERDRSWEAGLAESSRSAAVRTDLVEACVELARDEGLRGRTADRGRARAGLFSVDRFRTGVDEAYAIAMRGA